MKKIFYFSLALGAFGIMSCKKCQTCTTTTVQEISGYPPQTSSTSYEYCGKEYDSAPAEGTTSQNFSGINQSVTIECTDQ